MFAGNIGVAQSFDTILSAAQLAKDNREIHWIILGDGRMKDWVEAEVAARGLSGCVHLLGRRPTEQMPRYFAMADAMLVTLKKEPIFSLTVPAKIQSYLACGRPIVAALDGEGARVISESGSGIACPAEDAAGLANAVTALYHSSCEVRQMMGKSGLEYCEKHFEREMLLTKLEMLMGCAMVVVHNHAGDNGKYCQSLSKQCAALDGDHDRAGDILGATDVALVVLKKSPLFLTVLPSKMFEAMGAGKPVVLGVGGEVKVVLEQSGGRGRRTRGRRKPRERHLWPCRQSRAPDGIGCPRTGLCGVGIQSRDLGGSLRPTLANLVGNP